jgi:hypothetical protein
MIKHLLTVVFLFSSAITAIAQEKIETDRPDQTETPFTVPKGWWQFEVGLTKEKLSYGSLYTLPTILSKYGVSEKFELRLITGYTSHYTTKFTDTFGLSPVQVGFKLGLVEEQGIIPKISFIAHTGLSRLASKYYRGSSFFAPNFRFTMQHSLSDRVGLGYNLGAEWGDTRDNPIWIYTLAPGFNIGENWYAYIEAFGYIQSRKYAEHNFDGGIAYFLTDNTKLDLSAGVGLINSSLKHYIAAGFSFRIPSKKT